MLTTAPTEQRLASRPFWIAGGSHARDAAAACPYAPAHRWWTFLLGEVMAAEWFAGMDELVLGSDELTVCRGCLIVRCPAFDPSGEERCLRHMDHLEPFHRFAHRPAMPVRS